MVSLRADHSKAGMRLGGCGKIGGIDVGEAWP